MDRDVKDIQSQEELARIVYNVKELAEKMNENARLSNALVDGIEESAVQSIDFSREMKSTMDHYQMDTEPPIQVWKLSLTIIVTFLILWILSRIG